MVFQLPPDIRRATLEDVPVLRLLVNEAYRELADMGFNFTGTYQDEKITLERMQDAEVYLLYRNDELIASMNLSVKKLDDSGGRCVFSTARGLGAGRLFTKNLDTRRAKPLMALKSRLMVPYEFDRPANKNRIHIENICHQTRI